MNDAPAAADANARAYAVANALAHALAHAFADVCAIAIACASARAIASAHASGCRSRGPDRPARRGGGQPRRSRAGGRAGQVAVEGCAMLVRTAFLEGVSRFQDLYRVRPPAFVWQFTERVPMHRGKLTATGSTATAYCWLVWVAGAEGTGFGWIPPCRKRLERASDYAGVAA